MEKILKNGNFNRKFFFSKNFRAFSKKNLLKSARKVIEMTLKRLCAVITNSVLPKLSIFKVSLITFRNLYKSDQF
jgi:hypothetical protein